MDIDKLKFAVSCSSNMNRSMEAHSFLQKRGFNIESYGSGNQVKLPGTAIDKPNCYEFGKTTYDFIYNDLKAKDSIYYTQNGLLNMLDRNRRIKPAPQKFQHEDKEFDVIICLEERVYDQVVDHLHTRSITSGNPVHIINIDIEDNPEEATIGAWFVCELCGKRYDTYEMVLEYKVDDAFILNIPNQPLFRGRSMRPLFPVVRRVTFPSAMQLEECDDLDNEIDEILAEFEAKNQKRNILHTICFY